MKDRQLSKYLSLVLRHQPEDLGLQLDAGGWLGVQAVLMALQEKKGWVVQLSDLERIVAEDEKGRYTLHGGRLRANQGHSVPVPELELQQLQPPDVLYHGTTAASWETIQTSAGLLPMSRQHVHLSETPQTARSVAARRRKHASVLLLVQAGAMARDGHVFWRSSNGVWLTGDVPLQYIQVQD